MRPRGLPLRRDAAPHRLARRVRDGRVHHAALLRGPAHDDGEVFAHERVRVQPLREQLLFVRAARADEQAAGALVQAADGPKEKARRVAVIGAHAVLQRLAGLAGGGQRGQGRGLVHDEQVRVLVAHAEGVRP